MEKGDLPGVYRYLGVTPRQVSDSSGIDADEWRGAIDVICWGLWKLRVRPSQQTLWRQKMRAEGRCITCGKPAWRRGSSHCEAHLAKSGKNLRRSRRATAIIPST